MAALTVGWGLWRIGAGVLWWMTALASMIVAGFVLRWMAQVIMNQPSSAGDVLDLGWDDVLRFRRVRGLAVGAALGFPTLIVFLDVLVAFDLGHQRSFNFLFVVAAIAFMVSGAQIFKQGQRRWRRAWAPPQSPQTAQ
jgi:hypothetical protein